MLLFVWVFVFVALGITAAAVDPWGYGPYHYREPRGGKQYVVVAPVEAPESVEKT